MNETVTPARAAKSGTDALTPADIGAPPLGTIIDWVQGIMRRNTAQAGLDAVQISLRTSNDMQAQAPPNLSLAYPIAEDKIRVVFDKNLDLTTAENEANYTLGSGLTGSSVDDAVLVGGTGAVVDLTVTEVLPRLNLESIQTENIGSATCPACLSPQQSRTFVLGVLTVAELQAPLADSLLAEPCLDKSRFSGPGTALGPRVTVRGVISGKQSGALTFLADAAGGLRNGVAGVDLDCAAAVFMGFGSVALASIGVPRVQEPVLSISNRCCAPPRVGTGPRSPRGSPGCCVTVPLRDTRAPSMT